MDGASLELRKYEGNYTLGQNIAAPLNYKVNI